MSEKQEGFFSEKDLAYLQKQKIYIATPCYGGMTSAFYTQGIASLFQIAAAYGIHLAYETIVNESLITRARNNIVSDFLSLKDYTHLVFIDADIQFQALDVFRLILHRKKDAVVAGAYPMKAINWTAVSGQNTIEDMLEAASTYAINLPPEKTNGKETISVELEGDLLEVLDAGTGFMAIPRGVLENMIEEYGDDISYTGDDTYIDKKTGLLTKKTKTFYALFDTSIELKTNRYLSEDYTFCRRLQDIGGKIYIDHKIILNHVGSYVYRGYQFCKTPDDK
jgi:hypothetical protein